MAKVTNRVTVLRAPKDGQDATAYVVTPSVTSVHRNQFGTPSVDEFTVTSLKKVGDNAYEEFPPELLLSYERKTEDSDIGQWVTFGNPSADNIPAITVGDDDTEYNIRGSLEDGTVVCTVTVLVVKDGSDGLDGSNGHDILPRGPRDWADISDGEVMYDGSEPMDGTDIYIRDIVLHNGYCWLCVLGHVKNSDNEPQAGSANWRMFQTIDYVATKILLAQYALVKNLGVETIDMRDAAGNILFQAKDGNVICRTGTFENVVVSGLVRKKKTVVTSANFGNIFKVDQTHNDPDMGTYAYEIDFNSCGTWLEIQFLPSDITIYPKGHRDMCGNTILLYNKTSHTVGLIGNSAIKSATGPSPTSFQSFALQPDRFASIEFKIGAVNNKETAYFEVQFGTINKSIE